MNLGDKIKQVRKKRGLTQKQLGDLCGMADSAIRRYESGRGNPTQKTLERIGMALDYDFLALDSPRESTPESRHKIEELMGKEPGFLDGQLPTEKSETDKRIQRVKDAFDGMSQDGQEEATRRVEELARLPEYQKKESPSLSSLWGFDKRGEESAVYSQEND